MTYTRTYTIEERALQALCSGQPVTYTGSTADGTEGLFGEGRIIAIRAVDPDTPGEAGKRSVEVQDGVIVLTLPLDHNHIRFDA